MPRAVSSPRQMALRETLQRNVFRKPRATPPKGLAPAAGRGHDPRMSPGDLADPLPNWAAEFPGTDEARAFPAEAVHHAPALLEAFLAAARARSGGRLEEVSEAHLAAALLEDLPALAVPEAVRPHVPGMVRAFLGQLEDAGRLAGGRRAGAAIAAAGPAYLDRAAGKAAPARAAAKVGRNDPCPCGSGRKHKKCCGG